VERLLTVFDAATAPFEKGVSRVERALGRFERGVDKRLRNFDRRFEQSARSIRMLERALIALGTGAAANAARKYAESWRQLQRFMTAAGFEAEDARDRIIAASMRVRGDAEQFALAVKQLGLATGDGLDLTIRRAETLQKLLKLNGATAAQAGSTMLQLTQAIRAGTLQGDEFRSLRENAPAQFMEAIAREAGATIADLRQLSKEGKLSADLVIGALDSLDGLADRKFAKLALSGEEAFKILETGLAKFVGQVDESLGATETINRAIADMGEWLAGASEEAEVFAQGLKYVAAAAASLGVGLFGAKAVNSAQRMIVARRALIAAAVAENAEAQKNLVLARSKAAAAGASAAAANTLAVAEARAATAANALAAAQQRVTLAATAATAATAAFSRVLAFFGGPVGLVFTALAAGAIYYTAQAGAARRETELLANTGDDLVSTMDQLADKQRQVAELAGAAGGAQTEASRQARVALNAEIAVLELKLEKMREELRLAQDVRVSRGVELGREVVELTRAIDLYERVKKVRPDAVSQTGQTLEEMRATRDSLIQESRMLSTDYALADARLKAAEERAKAAKAAADAPAGAGAGATGGGKGKKDKPPELQGPEYDPGALFRDQLREARELLDENRTAEERLARAKQHLLDLQPALVEAIRAEAFAHGEVISAAEAEAQAKAAIERANERLVESAETVQNAQREAMREFAQGIASTIREADNLSDALDRIADQLLDMVLDDAFSTLFGGKASSPLGSIFGFISSGIGSLLGGGGGFTGLGIFADGGMVRGPGTGRSDSIPARLSNGEFVVNARATARNRGLLEAINSGRAFADGGLVTPSPAPVMAPPPVISPRAGVAATFAPSITVNVDGGDDPQGTGQAAARAVQAAVQAEMAKSLRPGGLLDNALKGKR
jgi:tape measure domain-containing protein